jgi:hypothetical protein
MPTEPLPRFRYHPDPLRTGSVVPSDVTCVVCGRARGSIYTGPVYAEEDLDDSICPWCIADGSAHLKFEAEFTDTAGVGGYGQWSPAPAHVCEEVAFRTPGFAGWQQERWFTCCDDAAAFLGPAGLTELAALDAGALGAIEQDSGLSGQQWEDYRTRLHRDRGPTAYVFRCLHCGRLGGYSDWH